MKTSIYIFVVLLFVSWQQKTKPPHHNSRKNASIDTVETGPAKVKEKESDNITFNVIETPPQLGNGDNDLKKYILDHIHYPQSAIRDSIQGCVYVHFIIIKDGSVKQVEVIRGVRSDIDSECVRVIKNMPKWTPAKRGGQLVSVLFTIPITFSLEADALKNERRITVTPKK